MKNKRIIILRGIGANFKSCIGKEFHNNLGYDFIPSNKSFVKVLTSHFEQESNLQLNYCAKYAIIKSHLENQNEVYISNGGLVEEAMKAYFIKNYLPHMKMSISGLSLDKAFDDECRLFNGYSIINVLVTTSDKKFLEKIIDDSYDSRAIFYDSSENYLECQDYFANYVVKNFDNIVKYDFFDVNNIKKGTQEFDDLINDAFKSIESLL